MLVRVFAAIAVAVLLAAGCGSGSDQVSPEEAQEAAEQAAADALEEERIRQAEEDAAVLEDELDALRDQLAEQQGDDGGGTGTGGNTGGGNTGGGNTGGGTAAADGLTYCTPNIAVNSVTSCPFASNVVETIQVEGLVFEAWSPTTEQWYQMSCVDFGDAVERTGGNNARVVYIP